MFKCTVVYKTYIDSHVKTGAKRIKPKATKLEACAEKRRLQKACAEKAAGAFR